MSGQAKLEQAFRELRRNWDRVRPYWADDRAREFHEQILEPLGPAIRSALNAMEHAENQTSAARRECE